jgi:hypothetical protein
MMLKDLKRMQDKKFLRRHAVIESGLITRGLISSSFCLVERKDLEIFHKYQDEIIDLISSQITLGGKK